MKVNLFRRFQFLFPSVVVLFWLLIPSLAAGQLNVQQTASSSGVVSRSSVSVAFPGAQTAGDLNLVVVGWSGTSAAVTSVADSNTQQYVLAAGTVTSALPEPAVSQAIYYFKNIAGGANTVTVTFNGNTASQDVRILEMSGADAALPIDVTAGASGNSSSADSGPATTNSANDALIGAGTTAGGFTSVGTGFFKEILNSFGDIVESKLVTTTGSYHTPASLGSSSAWVMQMVAIRAAAQPPVTFPVPTITTLSAASAPEAGGLPLTITGTNFAPGATVLFNNGTVTASGVNCSITVALTTILCSTPALPVGTGNVIVANVDGGVSAPMAFSFTASTPFTTTAGTISPSGGATNGGAAVTITGSDFAPGAKVTVSGSGADAVEVEDSGTIVAVLRAGSAGAATVTVTNPSGASGSPGSYTYATGAGINFIQANSAQPASPTASAPVAYSLAQTAGNLNVVVIGQADGTATVQGVTDSAGNTYVQALAATAGTGLSQNIYYAKNIKASTANTVTVTFSPSASTPDIRILEYSGLDTANPLDSAAGAAGSGNGLDSGPITTTSAGDMILGAATVGDVITAPGNACFGSGCGFATAIFTPYADNVEHAFPTVAGPFDATATQGKSDPWVIQGVAFRQPGTAVAGFTVSATALAPAPVAPGGSATSTVSVTPSNGFTSAVTLTCTAGLPAGATCAFVPPSVTPGTGPVTSVLTITTTAATPVATSTVTITGTSGSVVQTTTVSLTVAAAGTPSFTLMATALAPASVAPGSSATSTVSVTPSNGFTSAVTLTCTAGLPTGATCAFVPPSVTPTTAAVTSVLTITTTAATPAGTTTVTITGTAGSVVQTTTVSLTVASAAPANFTLTATPASASVAAGASTTSTIMIVPTGGFTGTVSLSCSITTTASPAPVCALPASATATATLTVSTTAPTSARLRSSGIFYAMLLPLGGLTLLGAGFSSRRKKVLGLLLIFLVISGLVFLGACGGGSSSGGGGGGKPGTPSGKYTVTVTGTSGTLTPQTTTFTLTVQ